MGANFSATITAEFGWKVDDLVLRKADLTEIVRYACGPRAVVGDNAGGGNGNGQARQQELEREIRRLMFERQMVIISDIVSATVGNGAAGVGGRIGRRVGGRVGGRGGGRGGRGIGAGRGNANANANAGGRGAAGGGRGAAGNAAPAPANGNAANGAAATATKTTGPYYDLFSVLAYTPTPQYIPSATVSRKTLEELFPKLVRWGILTEVRRGKVYALREPVAETQIVLRAALPSMLFDPALNPRALQNAERVGNLRVRPGLADIHRPAEMDAAVHLSTTSANSFASALLCLADLRPAMALFMVNEGMTASWMALGIIPGRNGPPMVHWQRVLVACANVLSLCLVVRGALGVLREAVRFLPLAAAAVSLAGAVLSEQPPRRWALHVVLYSCYSWAKTSAGYGLYVYLHLVWQLVMPKKWTTEAPYWLYGLLFAEVFVGYHLYPELPKLETSRHSLIYRLMLSFEKVTTKLAKEVFTTCTKVAVALLRGSCPSASVLADLLVYVVFVCMLRKFIIIECGKGKGTAAAAFVLVMFGLAVVDLYGFI